VLNSSLSPEVAQFVEDTFQGTLPREIQGRLQILSEPIREGNPTLADEVLLRLLDSASWMKPKDAELFLASEVTSDTFRFSQNFDSLLAPSKVDLTDKVFLHVNLSSVFSKAVGGELIPKYLLEGRPFDQENFEESILKDDYRVCVATGTVDTLSQYLAGHICVREASSVSHVLSFKEFDWRESAIDVFQSDPTKQAYSRNISIGWCYPCDSLVDPTEHDIETSYVLREEGTVGMRHSFGPVKMEVLGLPITVLTASQEQQILHAGGDIDHASPDQNRKNMQASYVAARHAELITKFALLDLDRVC
jgi:hypothetical protein